MYQEPDNNIGVIGLINPELERGHPNAGMVGKVEYIDYLNDGVGLDIDRSPFFLTEAILVLKPKSLFNEDLKKIEPNNIDKSTLLQFHELLNKQNDDSKKTALKLAYSNSELRNVAVVDFRDYIELDMEQHENIKRDRGR